MHFSQMVVMHILQEEELTSIGHLAITMNLKKTLKLELDILQKEKQKANITNMTQDV